MRGDLVGIISKEAPPSTAHRRGTLTSPADAAATELMLLRRSCSDATRRMMRPAFIFPRFDLNFNGRGPQSLLVELLNVKCYFEC